MFYYGVYRFIWIYVNIFPVRIVCPLHYCVAILLKLLKLDRHFKKLGI